jgi:hypothetical protein
LEKGIAAVINITRSQVAVFSAHVLTYGAGFVSALAAFHLISSGDASKITDAFSQIGSGLVSITAGLTTLAGIASALYAAWKASPLSQVKSVAALPQVSGVVTMPTVEGKALAAAAPGPDVAAAGTPAATTIATK